MKKFITVCVLAVAGVCLFGSSKPAEAQVIIYYSNQCCDTANVVRCTMPEMAPLGSRCYCYYQGFGHVC